MDVKALLKKWGWG